MSPNSIAKTAVVTPDGHWKRLPFGLNKAASHFSKIMYEASGDLNLNADKSKLFASNIHLLGHVKTTDGICMDPS